MALSRFFRLRDFIYFGPGNEKALFAGAPEPQQRVREVFPFEQSDVPVKA